MISKTISHYRILEKLGEGGMGVVYKAEDTKLKRTIALKFLSLQMVGSEEEKKRFVHEAQAAAALHHPNICTVHEIDEVEGQIFIAMAYLDGQSVREKIEARPLKFDEALDIAMQVADGLYEAHEQGIIHRDIKSSNVMITTKGQAILMDFGLAKQAGKTIITKEGTSMGTLAYMSLEQTQGAKVDQRTDIWSFGVMLYEMFIGQLPFKGEYDQAVMYSIMNEDPQPMTGLRTGVPMELERIVNKAMAKNPEERYQNANDMLIDLRALVKELEAAASEATRSIGARQTQTVTMSHFRDLSQRRVPRLRGSYFAASAAAVILIFSVIFVVWSTAIDEKVMTDSLEKALNEPVKTTVLNLRKKEIAKLRPEIGNLPNLEELDLSGNKLTELSAEILGLTKLQELDLSHNDLVSLPDNIGSFANLHILNLRWNQLTQLPTEFSILINLTELDLSHNNITDLSTEIVKLSRLKKLQSLKLSGCRLEQLPVEIFDLTDLKTLDLSDNNLTQLPPEIGQLTNLQILRLELNQLTQLPVEIETLRNLEVLDLYNNEFAAMNVELTNLRNLKTLDLRMNKLLETEIESIKRLLPNTKIKYREEL
ncbi:MAG: protein kinase [Bacteroidetes bacterium]|nr:protein kinase [Bacteroidota bacterium]